MKTYRIIWIGTVTGVDYVDANSLEEAIAKAEKYESSIEIEDYPDDWKIDKDLCEAVE
jgi:hypothetical protein